MYRYQQDYRRQGHLARATAAQVHHSHHSYEPQGNRQNQRRVHQAHPYRQAGSRDRVAAARADQPDEPHEHSVPHGPRVLHRPRVQQQQCNICSFSQRNGRRRAPVFHRHHFSSIHLRELTGVESTGSYYLCPSCKSHHTPYPKPRTKIIVSDNIKTTISK